VTVLKVRKVGEEGDDTITKKMDERELLEKIANDGEVQ
jgi:hypothetical protein